MQVNINSRRLQSYFEFFQKHDIEVYLVGGSIRDELSGKQAKDYDFATPDTPEEIIAKLGSEYINPLTENSSKFGTIFINFDEETIELTTFRKDITRGRHPKTEFTRNLNIDASRRDFTINCLYLSGYTYLNCDINDKVFIEDPTGYGIKDIETKTLRAVGNAFYRFAEDPLRIMRAIRFMCLGYKPEPKIIRFLKSMYLPTFLDQISIERIRDELLKILSINPRKGLKLLKKYKILEYIIPEVKDMYGYNQGVPEHHKWGLFNHSVLTAESIGQLDETDPELILIAFLHDIGKPHAMATFDNYHDHDIIGEVKINRIFQRLKFSNKSRLRARLLVRYHMRLHNNSSESNIRKTMYLVRKLDDPFDITALYHADLWGSRFEENPLQWTSTGKNPIDGYVCIDILKSMNSEAYVLISEMIEKAWMIIFKNVHITKENLIIRIENFTRSKLATLLTTQ